MENETLNSANTHVAAERASVTANVPTGDPQPNFSVASWPYSLRPLSHREYYSTTDDVVFAAAPLLEIQPAGEPVPPSPPTVVVQNTNYRPASPVTYENVVYSSKAELLRHLLRTLGYDVSSQEIKHKLNAVGLKVCTAEIERVRGILWRKWIAEQRPPLTSNSQVTNVIHANNEL